MTIFRFHRQAFVFFFLIAPVQASVLVSPEFSTHVQQDSPSDKEFRKGVDALLKSRLDEAEHAFLNSAKLNPNTAAPLLGLADIELKKKQPDKAAKWLVAADKAEPRSELVRLAWGRYYRNQKNDSRAEVMLKESIAIKPSASAYLELAQLYLADEKNARAALEMSKKAVSLSPTNPLVHHILAISLAANGLSDDAILEFERVTRLTPKDPEPWRAIGRLHAEKNRFSLATAALDKGIKLQPFHYDLLIDRGDIAMAQNKWGEAGRFYETAAKQRPASAVLLTKLGWLYYITQQAQKSEKAYKQAIQLEPNVPDSYNNLAWVILSDPTRQNEALKLSEKANQIAPNNPLYLDTLGWIHHLRGDDAKAEQIFRKAISFKPELPDIHHHLGMIYVTQGRKGEAISAFTRALELNPSFTFASDAKKHLTQLMQQESTRR